jgi:hypothetical protein
MDIVPPVDGSIPATVTEEQKETNAKRLLDEDKIRNTYVSTFYSIEKADSLAMHICNDKVMVLACGVFTFWFYI